MKLDAKNAFGIVCGAAAVILFAGMLSVTSSRPVNATPAFAASSGKACGFCHQNPAGGGGLNAAGAKFKANGNKL